MQLDFIVNPAHIKQFTICFLSHKIACCIHARAGGAVDFRHKPASRLGRTISVAVSDPRSGQIKFCDNIVRDRLHPLIKHVTTRSQDRPANWRRLAVAGMDLMADRVNRCFSRPIKIEQTRTPARQLKSYVRGKCFSSRQQRHRFSAPLEATGKHQAPHRRGTLHGINGLTLDQLDYRMSLERGGCRSDYNTRAYANGR
ncbi:hypothetical protein PFLU3_17890 [Pseudomonas fluorescens]|uniref:Uncharacterized protein n=1 Tax=Pseudomonas fluorescens TaxID=294 RepID=A0A0D0TP64_PSEFL|nr:hypothetical protein PFLU3_17890 [Pseudomonas fluorescens]